MRTEYKRDMNHNYLIVYGENEINTDSYQVRMLAGNVIPSLLKCRIQGMDGRFLIYFDITSKQAVNVLYEEKKMGVEDLRLIFGGFVKAMEDAAEYLINPGQFIMSPEYIYTDIEKRQIAEKILPLLPSEWHKEILYFAENEFADRAIIDGKIKLLSHPEEISEKYNEDQYSAVDGSILKGCDHLAAFVEAWLSIRHGITSQHLREGEEKIREMYKSKSIAGISFAEIFGKFN